MKKLSLILALCLLFTAKTSFAASSKIDLDAIIKNSKLDNTATVAVSVRNAQTGSVEYQYNQNKLLHPASVLKILTLPAVLNTLTPDYKYETKFAVDNNNLYILLSGDPSLNSSQLKTAFSKLPKRNWENIYIDDKALDRFEWGIGWMWDDETNPRMAKISPYNLNQNILTVKIEPTENGQSANITSLAPGTATVVNMLTTGDKDDITVFRQNSISPNLVYLYGTVQNPQKIKVPIGNPERFFLTNINNILKSKNLNSPPPQIAIYPVNKTIYTISNDIMPAIPKILQDSENFYAETLFKTAGGVNAGEQGTFENAKKVFDNYYKKLGLNPDKIVLADGSGVSRNNLFSADWITCALFKIQKDKNFDLIKSNMAYPTVGTMKNRLVNFNEVLKVKTGTLANNSTIAGYIVDKNGYEHIFSIFVANYNTDARNVRDFQNKIITAIYEK